MIRPRGALQWVFPTGGFADTGGPLTELRFGITDPSQAFGPTWGLHWMLPPPTGWAFVDLHLQDLRWEHVCVEILRPLGGRPLADYQPVSGVPTLDVMVRRLLDDGFSGSIAHGGQSHVGAWALDLTFTELYVRNNLIRTNATYTAVFNATYNEAVRAMAWAANRPFSDVWETWTSELGGAHSARSLGNIIETYAIWLLRRQEWQALADLVHLLAWCDRGHPGLFRCVGRSPLIDVGAGGRVQVRAPPSSLGGRTGLSTSTSPRPRRPRCLRRPLVTETARGTWRPRPGTALALPTDGGPRPHGGINRRHRLWRPVITTRLPRPTRWAPLPRRRPTWKTGARGRLGRLTSGRSPTSRGWATRQSRGSLMATS